MMVEDGPRADGLQIVSDTFEDVLEDDVISLSAVEWDGEEDAECRAVNKQIKIPCLLSPPAYKNTKAPNSQQGGSLHPAFSARQYQYTREATREKTYLVELKL